MQDVLSYCQYTSSLPIQYNLHILPYNNIRRGSMLPIYELLGLLTIQDVAMSLLGMDIQPIDKDSNGARPTNHPPAHPHFHQMRIRTAVE